jgi:hypothetical protein
VSGEGSTGNEKGEKVFVGLVRPATAESQRWAEPLVARLAAETWRLGRRLGRIETGAPDDERLRPLRDSFSRLDDIFAEYRVQIVEHEGQPYNPGLQVEVLHAREGDGSPIILETIRPTILLDGRVLQQGQVVIGPAEEGGS